MQITGECEYSWYISKVDEFAKRIVNYHGMPVYLEEGIIHLKRFFIVGCNV